MVSFEKIKEAYLPLIEKELEAFFVQASRDTGRALSEMSAYHFATGGKRLRALIPLYVYELLGHEGRALLPFGVAVEMIHNATLVHDDLQDGDEVRRNRPTIWKKFSSAQAINCGDAMFQYATQLLMGLKLDPAVTVKLSKRAAEATLRVIEGQAQEFIMKEEAAPHVERYLNVIRGKTSGLFALPVVGALEAAGVAGSVCQMVEAAAMDLGVLFQIQDDVLDVYGEKGREQRASDIAEGKISIFVAHVNEVGTEMDRQQLNSILRKPRAQTTTQDIQQAIGIFEKYRAKEMAIGYIRKIQNTLRGHEQLKRVAPEVHGALTQLSDIFLTPIAEVI